MKFKKGQIVSLDYMVETRGYMGFGIIQKRHPNGSFSIGYNYEPMFKKHSEIYWDEIESMKLYNGKCLNFLVKCYLKDIL